MAGYTLIGSASIVQVLSPTVSEDMVAATILTKPTGVVATALVSQVAFDNNSAAEELSAVANNIETIIAQGKAVSGTSSQTLNASGLLDYFVTFTVAYNPPGAPAGAVTVDVDVPVNLISVSDPAINKVLLPQAEAIVDKAYQSLVSMAGG
jgi:hypothetical protein